MKPVDDGMPLVYAKSWIRKWWSVRAWRAFWTNPVMSPSIPVKYDGDIRDDIRAILFCIGVALANRSEDCYTTVPPRGMDGFLRVWRWPILLAGYIVECIKAYTRTRDSSHALHRRVLEIPSLTGDPAYTNRALAEMQEGFDVILEAFRDSPDNPFHFRERRREDRKGTFLVEYLSSLRFPAKPAIPKKAMGCFDLAKGFIEKLNAMQYGSPRRPETAASPVPAVADETADESPANLDGNPSPPHPSGFKNPSVEMEVEKILKMMSREYNSKNRRNFTRNYKDHIARPKGSRKRYWLDLDYKEFKGYGFEPDTRRK